jgi:hypothetical protein
LSTTIGLRILSGYLGGNLETATKTTTNPKNGWFYEMTFEVIKTKK